jgi:hypothetical protein
MVRFALISRRLKRGEMYEEINFGDGFARHDFGVGLIGAGYSPLPQDALNVTVGSARSRVA